MKKRSFYLAFLALVCFLFVLVACSDDKDEPAPSPAKPSSSSAIAGGPSSPAGNSSSSAATTSSPSGNSSSSAGISSSADGESSSSLTGISSSEDGESSSSQNSVASSSSTGSIASGSSSSEGATSFRIPGATTGADLTTAGTGYDANTIIAANATVTNVCFNVNTTIAFTPSKNIVTVSCRVRTSPAKALDIVVGYGGKCYKFVYPEALVLAPLRIPIELDSPPNGNVEAQDVCVNFSQNITHTSAVLACGIVNSTATPPDLGTDGTGTKAATSVTALACPWL